MKTPKFSKLLPLVMALALATTGAMAVTEDTNATGNADYELTLNEFFDIEVTAPVAAAVVEYGSNYTSATMDRSLVGSFQVISNKTSEDIYLYGKCATDGDDAPALYGSKDALKLVFTNQSAGEKATNAAVENIRGGSAATMQNANAIAFPVVITSTHEEGPTNAFIADEFDGKNMHYTIENGKAVITCTVGTVAEPQTFSTRDTNGTYKATLYLDKVGLQ